MRVFSIAKDIRAMDTVFESNIRYALIEIVENSNIVIGRNLFVGPALNIWKNDFDLN